MNLNNAILEARRWLSHLDRQRERSLALQEAARMARHGRAEDARRIVRYVDKNPIVYDAANLQQAVTVMIAALAAREVEIE